MCRIETDQVSIMNLPTRHMLLGMTLGAICASALAAMGPGYVMEAFADEMPAGFDTDKLVKFDDREYSVSYADWVSTDPLSTAMVKKIEAGKVSYVSITTTATGTYSSDSLTSKHVLYPGIDVQRVSSPADNWFAFWSGGKWHGFASKNGNSFIAMNTPVNR